MIQGWNSDLVQSFQIATSEITGTTGITGTTEYAGDSLLKQQQLLEQLASRSSRSSRISCFSRFNDNNLQQLAIDPHRSTHGHRLSTQSRESAGDSSRYV
jgi:hypothetical protein